MKIILLAWVLGAGYLTAAAQDSQKEKIEAVKVRVVKYFNAYQPDSIYALAGPVFRKQLSAEVFKKVYENNLVPLGILNADEFESMDGRVAKYKAVFAAGTFSMYLSLDSTGLIETFLFQPYKKAVTGPVVKTTTDNKLLTDQDKKLDEFIQRFMFESQAVGLSMGVLKDGKPFFYNYGETVKGNKQLPTNKNLYEIGSVTKTFTGILLAKAVTEGKIKLSDPVNLYLPKDAAWLVSGNDTARIVHLSNHTSGILPLPDNFDMTNMENPYKDYGEDKLLAYLKTAQLQRRPGEKFEYCNLGVGMLGYILSKIYKMPYEAMVTTFITSKAGMHDTREFLQRQDSALMVQGYNDAVQKQGPWDFKVLTAAGSLRSNTADMLKYAMLNLHSNDTALQKAITLSHQVTYDAGKQKVGLNWFVQNWGWGDIYFHGGATGGYRSFFAVNPATKNAVVLLCNTFVNVDEAGVKLLKNLDQ
ncbi:MAG: serine hydrolase domain-containing protein [Ferruginibacter sp.]